MFSALSQGNHIYILDKSNGIKLSIGEIVGVSQPKYQQYGATPTVDIKVSVDGNTIEYNNIPSSYSIVSYHNGKLTLSETKQELQSEVETILTNCRQTLNNIETYKKNAEECERILKELNPQFAKDKERDEKIEGLEKKIDQLLAVIKNDSIRSIQ